MASPYNITISSGTGEEGILNGSYKVSADVTGYENSSIEPTSVNVVAGTNSYSFTIAASGSLTLHVTEDGTSSGTPVVGATFSRTDSKGTKYGESVTTDSSGNAVLANVPYAEADAPIIYYVQTGSDGNHEFSTTVASTTMTGPTSTIEIQNSAAATRTINLTDANYANLPIESGTLTLTSN